MNSLVKFHRDKIMPEQNNLLRASPSVNQVIFLMFGLLLSAVLP